MILSEMMAPHNRSRYLGLCYEWTNPTWTDGRSSGTFNFYYAWKPLTQHPAISFPLQTALSSFETEDGWASPGLGCDDYPPTHLLMLDWTEQKMAIAPYKTGMQFLADQHPPRPPATPEQIEAERKAVMEMLAAARLDQQQMPRQGMLERVLITDALLTMQSKVMVEFLDQHLDPNIRDTLKRFELS